MELRHMGTSCGLLSFGCDVSDSIDHAISTTYFPRRSTAPLDHGKQRSKNDVLNNVLA